jgi:hypothetical protein
VPSQYTALTSAPPSTQLNFRKMIGEVCSWNPDLDPLAAGRMINNCYRKIIDNRMWYGLMVKGQVTVPNAYATGTCSVTTGSNEIPIVGAVLTTSMIGMQIRAGFSYPIYTITEVDTVSQVVTTDIAWGGPTLSGIGYQIFQNIVTPHPNLKLMLAMVNQSQGFRLKLHIPQEVINIYDTWRTTTGWTYFLADAYPSPQGTPQFELYPIPTYQQAFPYLAYVQPPDMVNDNDTPVTFIRSDVIVLGAISDALVYRGKNSKYYDPQTSLYKKKEWAAEMENMSRTDDSLALRNLVWEFDKFPQSRFGAQWLQSHDLDSLSL